MRIVTGAVNLTKLWLSLSYTEITLSQWNLYEP